MDPAKNLVEAIDRLDLEGVQRLMDAGANPYTNEPGEISGAQNWLHSQRIGNPYAIEMAKILFKNKPTSQQDQGALNELVQGQVGRLAEVLGEAETGNNAGIAIELARTGVQDLENAQACWALVRQAYSDTHEADPVIPASLYAEHLALGVARARSLLEPIGGGNARQKATHLPINADPKMVESIIQTISAKVDPENMTVLPRGSVATIAPVMSNDNAYFVGGPTLMQPANGHFASTFRGTLDGAIIDLNQGEVSGLNPTAWWPKDQERRLAEALAENKWEKAGAIIQAPGGPDINILATKLYGDSAWLGNCQNAEQTKALIALGADPWLKTAANFEMPGYEVLPIEHAKSQEQFDLLMAHMKHTRPEMDTGSFKSENGRVQKFYNDSPYFEDKRSPAQRVADRLADHVGEILMRAIDKIGDAIGPKTVQPGVTADGSESAFTSRLKARQEMLADAVNEPEANAQAPRVKRPGG